MTVARHEMPGKHPGGTRPVGYGMIGWRAGGPLSRWWTKRGATDHIRRGGDGSCLTPHPGISCLATLVSSLRDKG